MTTKQSPRWNSSDDARLITLWRTPHNQVDPTKLDKDSVEAVRATYWPHSKYHNFAPLYRGKAREFNVSKTLDGHRKRSAARRASEEGKIRLEDISDDSESYNDYEEIDLEEDSDLEGFEEEDIEAEPMPTATPVRKKRAAANKATTPVGPATEDSIGKLSASMKKMSVENQSFSMDFKLPWILYTYQEGNEDYCSVDFFSPVLPKGYFYPDVIDGGNKLAMTVRIPSFFTQPKRKVKVKRSKNFNENTSEAQAFKTVCHDIDAHYDLKDYKAGEPTIVALPFTCEERLVEWEVQGYKNNLDTLADDLGGQQFHWCVSVTIRKLAYKIRMEGKFQVVEDSEDEAAEEPMAD